jgi:hypothetical protein
METLTLFMQVVQGSGRNLDARTCDCDMTGKGETASAIAMLAQLLDCID